MTVSQILDVIHVTDPKDIQRDMRMICDTLQERANQANGGRSREERERAAEARKKRNQSVTAWCKENLKEGMLVTVVSQATTTVRKVLRVDSGQFIGHHMHWDKGEKAYVEGMYITDHLFDRVTNVMVDGRWKSVVSIIKDSGDAI